MYYLLITILFIAVIVLVFIIASYREKLLISQISKLLKEAKDHTKTISQLHWSVESLNSLLIEKEHEYEDKKKLLEKSYEEKYITLFKDWKEEELEKEVKKVIDNKIEEWEEEIHRH